MKRFLIIFFVVTLLFIQSNIKAQSNEYEFQTKTFLPLKKFPEFKKTRKYLYTYLWLWAQGQFSAHLEFPKDAEKAFSFLEPDAYYFPSEWKQCLWNNKEYFKFETTDNSLYITYKEKPFAKFIVNFNCDDASNIVKYINYFQVYDTLDLLVEIDDSVYIEFWKMFHDSTILFQNDTCLKIMSPSSKDSSRFIYPSIRIFYQYDSNGLQIHPRCKECYELEKNQYTVSLEKTAKDFCMKKGYYKLVFTAFYVKRIKSPECDCKPTQ